MESTDVSSSSLSGSSSEEMSKKSITKSNNTMTPNQFMSQLFCQTQACHVEQIANSPMSTIYDQSSSTPQDSGKNPTTPAHATAPASIMKTPGLGIPTPASTLKPLAEVADEAFFPPDMILTANGTATTSSSTTNSTPSDKENGNRIAALPPKNSEQPLQLPPNQNDQSGNAWKKQLDDALAESRGQHELELKEMKAKLDFQRQSELDQLRDKLERQHTRHLEQILEKSRRETREEFHRELGKVVQAHDAQAKEKLIRALRRQEDAYQVKIQQLVPSHPKMEEMEGLHYLDLENSRSDPDEPSHGEDAAFAMKQVLKETIANHKEQIQQLKQDFQKQLEDKQDNVKDYEEKLQKIKDDGVENVIKAEFEERMSIREKEIREEMQSKLDEMQKKFNEQKESLGKVVDAKDGEIATLVAEYEEKLVLRSSNSSSSSVTAEEFEERIEELERKLIDKEREENDLRDQLKAEINSLKSESDHNMKEALDELESALVDFESERKKFETKITTLEDDVKTKRHTISAMKSKHLEAIKFQHEEFEKQMKEGREAWSDFATRETAMKNRISTLEAELSVATNEIENRVKIVRLEHTKELDEMLEQLDLVEAEHRERCDELEKVAMQKDTVISALGAQLGEASTRFKELETQHQVTVDELRDAHGQITLALDTSKELEEQMDKMQVEHKKALAEEKRKRIDACEKTRQEMIAAAEEQFAQANHTYMQLKHDYEASVTRISKLERDLRSAKHEVEKTKKVSSSKEMEMAAELAQLKANIATVQAEMAQRINQFNAEFQNAVSERKQVESQLEESIQKCETVQVSLSNMVTEKERLVKENSELNKICEELMTIVEGAGGK